MGKRLAQGAVGAVANSMEFRRVFGLPWREAPLEEPDTVPDVTPLYQKPGAEMRLWPTQSAALIEASAADGLFASIRVGGGKTLIVLLLADAMEADNAVILVKPDLKRQLEREIDTVYGKHFNIPKDRFTIVAYSQLSSAKHATILDDIGPDLIISDECHCLKNPKAARTKRFLRYARNNPSCRFAFLSGTITNRSILDYAHLIELALRKNSPLPKGWNEVREWSGAIDVNPDFIMKPGALKKLCAEGESVREGYRRRLVGTQGVIATKEGELGTSLIIRRKAPKLPARVVEMISDVKATWSIEGEEIDDAMTMARVIKQLSCGFYYVWDWPDGQPDYDWLQARADWHREVREKLKFAQTGMDSPFLLAQAAERYRKWDAKGRQDKRPEKAWDSATWEAWRDVKDRKPPPTKAIWIDDFLIHAALDWASRNQGVIWYEWKTVGERIARLGGLPHYGAGTDAGEATAKTIVCSIATQGTGKNLQRFNRCLFTTVPPNGTTMEQAIGRFHRPGQEADEVVVDWYAHTDVLEECMAKAVADAQYMESTTGQSQKLLYATMV